ncbi:insulin-like growth factor binding protein [Anaeramoeba flamelloides]|uniref:Insulin-like growth factor binding protein n=1 Tax=Anaeramoeba flamelloides TaxID=1746091 RepID=A0ABQ8ZDL3_9EUKA|nr:insulin-like growth factor binding protein [Anaeramoeba flamelloides]
MKKILWKNSFIFLIVLLVLSSKVFSSCDRYVEVGGNGNGECDTEDSPCGSIKYAVEKSANNDIICVGPGTYTFESEISTSKDLTIIATSYPDEETIIDGTGFNVRAFHLQSNDFIINGFTIQNFRVNNLHGCPFFLDCYPQNASRSIQFINCIIKDNKAHTGIIKSYGCYLNFENVRIQSNEAIGQGGGLFCDRNENYIQPQIKYTDLIISGNSAQSFDNIFNQLKTGTYEGPACTLVSGPDLQSCDECKKGGNCNPETGSCYCLPGSHLPSPGCEFCQPGQYSTEVNSTVCSICDAGEFNTEIGLTKCQKCDPGSYQDQEGQSECKECDAGFYNSNNGSDSINDCNPCEIGSYSDQTGQSECQECDFGSYQDQTGKLECIKCDAGFYNIKQGSNSSSDCIRCEKGAYSDQTGQSECQKCDHGSYQDQEGQNKCIKCDAGFYNTKQGSDSIDDCIPCKKGTYSNQTGQTKCPKCDQGSYQDQEGQVECIKCKKGSYNSNQGSTSSSDCFECEIGLYSDQEGSSSCSLCSQGQYNNKRNSTTCLDCSTGSYSNREGQTVCQYCSAGEYQDELHSVQCKPCSFNTWQSNTGSYKCNYCPMNSITLTSNTIDPKECFCSVGYFGKAGESCEKCPTNGICDQLNQQNPKPQSGYWNSNNNPQDLIKCKIEDACPGNGIGVCNGELGYTGFQCEQCLSGFYKFEEQCLTCPDNNWFRLLLAFFLLLPSGNQQNKYLKPFIYLKYYCFSFWVNGMDKNNLKDFTNNCINSFVAFIFLMYLILCLKILEIFDCTKITNQNNQEYSYQLKANLQYNCFDEWWYRLLPFVIIFGILYIIGIPIFLGWSLYYHSKKVDEKTFNQRFGLLTNKFKKEWFFWEFVLTLRKIVVVIIVLYLSATSGIWYWFPFMGFTY